MSYWIMVVVFNFTLANGTPDNIRVELTDRYATQAKCQADIDDVLKKLVRDAHSGAVRIPYRKQQQVLTFDATCELAGGKGALFLHFPGDVDRNHSDVPLHDKRALADALRD